MADVKEAMAAWHAETARLKPEILRDPVAYALHHVACMAFGAFRAEVARLKAELDLAGRKTVLLCPSSAMLDAMEASEGEEDGTIMRATDDPSLEFELRDRMWHRAG